MANKTPLTTTSTGQVQAIQAGDTIDPSFLPAGVASGPMNYAEVDGAGPTLTTTEATVGTISLTGVASTSPVLVVARINFLKDTGTTVRTTTMRVRRGSTNSDTQIGRDSNLRSQGVASTDFGPGVVVGIDTGHGGGSLTYTSRALASAASAATTPHYEIVAVELTGLQGADGADGAGWVDYPGIPPGAFGVDGNYCLDTTTGDVYFKSGTWSIVTNIKGPAGGSPPTGTGFVHVTAGAQDSAAVGETGTGNVMRAVSPTTTGTLTAATINASGTVTSSSSITAAQDFKSSTTAAVLATSAAGTVYLRPNGAASTSGQVTINTAGQVTGPSDFFSGGAYSSTTTSAVLCTNSAGTVYLRPSGNTTTGQAQLQSDGTWTIGSTAGAATSQPTLVVTNSTRVLYVLPWVGGGSYNGSNVAGDTAVMALGSSAGTGVLNLTTWSGTSVGVRITGTDVALTGTNVTVNSNPVGFRNVPLNTQNATYTFVADDAGKCRVHTDTTAYTWTINTGVHAAGDVLTVLNNTGTGAITIAAGAGVTLYLAGTTTTGNRTVAVRGVATVFMASSSVGYVSGPGVT